MPPSVIDLRKLQASNRKASEAIRHGTEGGVLAIVKDAALRSMNTKAVKNRTGAMRGGWSYRLILGKPNRVTGQLRNTVLHSKFQEEGTGNFGAIKCGYFITAKPGKTLAFMGRNGKMVFRKWVFHPGVRPQFIGRAAMFGHDTPFYTADHDRNVRVLTRWINGELARVK
jgi:hypothetical protein